MDEDKKKLLNICIAELREFCRAHNDCGECALLDVACDGDSADNLFPALWKNVVQVIVNEKDQTKAKNVCGQAYDC